MTERFRFLTLAMASFLLASMAVETHAQPGTRGAAQQRSAFTQNQLNQITSRSNASRFSASRFRNQTVNRTVPRYNYSTANRSLSNRLNRPTKPFSGTVRGPSTTPYLGLSRPFGGVSDIYDVRRRASQQRVFQQQQRTNDRQRSQNWPRKAPTVPKVLKRWHRLAMRQFS